eukprot:scaffold10339_cov41-Cyclotella_meneghiniana.AAC.10
MGNGGISSNVRTDQDAACSQSRAGRFFRSDGGRYLQQVKSRLRAFKRGTSRRNRRVRPLPAEVDAHSARQFGQYTVDAPLTPDVATELAAEQVVVDRLVDEIHEGGYGFVEGRKPADVVRLMGENVNNLSL